MKNMGQLALAAAGLAVACLRLGMSRPRLPLPMKRRLPAIVSACGRRAFRWGVEFDVVRWSDGTDVVPVPDVRFRVRMRYAVPRADGAVRGAYMRLLLVRMHGSSGSRFPGARARRWEVEAVPDGEAALARLAVAPVDAVVLDSCCPARTAFPFYRVARTW